MRQLPPSTISRYLGFGKCGQPELQLHQHIMMKQNSVITSESLTKNTHKSPCKRSQRSPTQQLFLCPLHLVCFVSVPQSSPRRTQYHSHARRSKNMLGFSAQVRICCKSSLSSYYHYQLFQGTQNDFTGGQGGDFSPS